MDFQRVRYDDLAVVVLQTEDHRPGILCCLEALATRRVPYSVHLLDPDWERAKEELDILASTKVRVIIVPDMAFSSKAHFPGKIASHLSESNIIVVGFLLPGVTITLQAICAPKGTALLWGTDPASAGVAAAAIAALDYKVLALDQD